MLYHSEEEKGLINALITELQGFEIEKKISLRIALVYDRSFQLYFFLISFAFLHKIW